MKVNTKRIDLKQLSKFEHIIKRLCKQTLSILNDTDPTYKIAKKHLFRPIDYHACSDFISCYKLLLPINNMRILDISSHQWFLLCLAELHPDSQFVYCTILEKDIIPFQIIAEINNIKNIEFKKQDARKLDFSNAVFDQIVSISVLEHIYPEKGGDVIAFKEIKRVLKKDGFFVVLIPFKSKSNVVYINGPIYERTDNKKNFFAREYDKETLNNLLDEVKLNIISRYYIVEKRGFFPIDYLIYGPGKNSPYSLFIINILKRLEKKIGQSLERYLSFYYLRVVEFPEYRLVNIALKLKK